MNDILLLKLLKKIENGQYNFATSDDSLDSLKSFQSTARALIYLKDQGYIENCKYQISKRRNSYGLYLNVAIIRGLSYKGEQKLKEHEIIVKDINELNHLRLLFLRKLYELSKGNIHETIDRNNIYKVMNLNKKNNQSEQIENYLKGENLIDYPCYGSISITHDGIKKIEEYFLSLPDRKPKISNDSSNVLSIFLCHSSGDKIEVRKLYNLLSEKKYAPWLDERNLLPGQNWELEIKKAVASSHIVLVCLSQDSINKAGYIHKEIKYALDVAEEQPEGTIFIIPAKLEECDIPERLKRWQAVNLFEENGQRLLMEALNSRANNIK